MLDQIFTVPQRAHLRAAFGLAADADLQPLLEKLAAAALTEYRDTFFAEGLLSTAAEFRQRRLLLLLLYVFDDLPNEHDLARLLHLSASEASKLLNLVSVKFAEQLRAKIEAAVSDALSNDIASERKNCRGVFIRSNTTRQAIDALIDDLNRQKPEGPYAAKLIRHRTVNGLFDIGEPTLQELKARLKI
jgi:hypothetical protein